MPLVQTAAGSQLAGNNTFYGTVRVLILRLIMKLKEIIRAE